MHVEDVERLAILEINVRLQHAAFFASLLCELVVSPVSQGQARERHISIAAATQRPVRSEAPRILRQCPRDLSGLVEDARAIRRIHDLLEAQYLRLELPDYSDDPFR
jgi:hypothetical protein